MCKGGITMNIPFMSEFIELKARIEKETGFTCYDNPNAQMVFFGTSKMLSKFKELAEPYISTGTMAYCIDTKEQQIWSAFEKAWF